MGVHLGIPVQLEDSLRCALPSARAADLVAVPNHWLQLLPAMQLQVVPLVHQRTEISRDRVRFGARLLRRRRSRANHLQQVEVEVVHKLPVQDDLANAFIERRHVLDL